ncbi:MAG: HNH endonuclease [Victivallaceae bacterium]
MVVRGNTIYFRHLASKILRANGRGYKLVSINDKTYSVHRLIALTFISNPRGVGFVNHKDGNKSNNCVNNLEWVSCSENELHSYRTLGKRTWNTGKHYDVTNAQLVRNKNHLAFCHALLGEWIAGATKKSLAQKYNRCYRQICDNINRARRAG